MTARPGRRALFESTGAEPNADVGPMDEERPFFSAPPRRSGTVVVECSRCEARTPVAASEVLPQVATSLWWPGRLFARHPHRLRCPACAERTWCRLR